MARKRKCKVCSKKVNSENMALEYLDGTVQCDDCVKWKTIPQTDWDKIGYGL